MDRDGLTPRQCYFLLFLFLLGNLVTAAGAKGTQAGWLLFLLLGGLAVPVFWLFHKATGGYPPGAAFVRTLGTLPGAAVTLVYGVLSVLLAGDAMRLFADFIVINDLNDAGAWGNTALLTLSVCLMLLCTVRSMGKAGWAVQPAAVLLLLLSVAVTEKEMDLHRLLPLFAEPPRLLLRSGISSFSTMITAAFFPIAALGTGRTRAGRRGVYFAGITACVLMAVLSLRDAAVLGYPAIGVFRFPMFAAASTMRHSQILVSAVFVLTQPFRAALCLRYAQTCLEYFLPRFSRWYPFLLPLLAVVSGSLSWSSEQVRWRTVGESVLALLLLAGPMAAVLAQKRRERNTRA